MIPGPYAIYHAYFANADTDMPTLGPLKYGYDTAQQAFDALPSVAAEAQVDVADCTVVRYIEREEAAGFAN